MGMPTAGGEERPLRIAVAGGGLSGLAAAHRLLELAASAGRPLALTLFEGRDRLGGVIGTETVDDYRLEMGADSFITNKPWGLELCRRLGLEPRLVSTSPEYRRSLILQRGRPVAVPEGFQLLSPAAIGPFLRSPLLSWRGKLRAMCEPLIPRRRRSDDESLDSFVRRRFGAEMLERIAQPLVGGIYTADPRVLSMRAALPRFVELEQKYGSVILGLRAELGASSDAGSSGARYGLFVTLRGGMGELLAALERRIVERGVCVRSASPVDAINLGVDPEAAYDVIHRGPQGGRIAADGVVLAMPAYRAAALVRGMNPRLAAALDRIEYASTAIVVTVHRLSDVSHPLDAFGLVVPAAERRRVLAVSFTSRKFPERAPAGCVQLRTFIGGAMQPELLERSDDALRELTREELRDLLGVHGEPLEARVVRWERAMPQYQVGHVQLVTVIGALASAHPRVVLTGNAYRGVGVPDVIHDAEQAAERLWAKLVRQPPLGESAAPRGA